MTSRDFCFWLQGHFEISNNKELNAHQTDMIRRHLSLVFLHEIDPSMPDTDGKLQAVHDGKLDPSAVLSALQEITHSNGVVHGGFSPFNQGGNPGEPVMRC